MSSFVLTRSVLRTIRQHAGRIDKARIAELIGCSVARLEGICRQHAISLKLDVDETAARVR